jgi:cell division protein FtsA
MKSTVAAIDFGTGKIVALVAETSGRQRCDIVGAGISSYDGFSNGQWNGADTVNEAIASAIHEAETQSHIHVREINVGVPGEFSRVYAIEVKISLQGADPHVTLKDIEEIMSRASADLGTVRGVVIHRSPAWFMVDDGKKTLEPMNMRGYEMRAMISFVVADQFFLDDISERFRALGITVNSFFSTPTGQAMLFLSDEERDKTALLIDIGYLNTEVMAVEGDALIFHKVLPLGGGNISADLAYGLDIPLASAEQIKRGYLFGLSTGQSGFDVTAKDGTPLTIAREKVSAILEPRVEEIAESIRDCVKGSGVRFGSWSVAYLTGGGLAINRGGRDYLSAKLDRPVRELVRKAVKLSSPAYSSALGLLDLIIDTINNQRNAPGGVKSFFSGLFGG